MLPEGEDDASFHLSEIASLHGIEQIRDSPNETNREVVSSDLVEQRDHRVLMLLKFSVLLLLIVAGIALSVTAFYFTKSEDTNTFHSEFEGYASKLLEAFYDGGDLRLWTAVTLSTVYTAEFGQTKQWPNVTLLDFSRSTVGLSYISKSDDIIFAPLVTTKARAGWEQYAVENQQLLYGTSVQADGNIDDAASISSVYAELCGQNYTYPRIEDGIYNFTSHCSFETAKGPGPFMPVWQTGPPDVTKKMRDLFSIEAHVDNLLAIFQDKKPRLSEILILDGHPPCSVLYFPVFQDFAEDPNVVGIIVLRFDWRSLMSNILPEHAVGLLVELNNTCDQHISLEVNGPDVITLGTGSYHNIKYSHDSIGGKGTLYHHGRYYQELLHYVEANITSSRSFHHIDEYEEIDDDSLCRYEIHIYPSDHFRSVYSSSLPVIAATVVALIFVFAIVIFLAYDYLVERRQRRVIKSAARSTAIVNALFPSVVRDRVFGDGSDNGQGFAQRAKGFLMGTTVGQEEGSERTTKSRNAAAISDVLSISERSGRSSRSSWHKLTHIHDSEHSRQPTNLPVLPETPKLRLKSYLVDTPSVASSDFDSEPIAEMFPDTTIMFADIAGFTAWSSEREPSQVFILLETLYRAFDGVANRLGVFKVETIGDCYVAVCGLPDPNEHHAVVMTYFAYECIRQMKDLIRTLEAKLGPGTSDLSLRVGLNSGPVTAGVLRGEKSRFQLFGDSVNMAARMESTGEAKMIHASQETSDLLVAAGKVNWVTAREDVVFVKGKGDMQTFWLKPRRGSSRGSTNSYLMDNSSCASSTVDTRPRPRSGQPAKAPVPKSRRTHSVSTSSSQKQNGEVKKWGQINIDDSLQSKANANNQRREAQKRARLVDWNVDLLLSFLAKVVAARESPFFDEATTRSRESLDGENVEVAKSTKILEEVTEIIDFPDFDEEKATRNTINVMLPPEVREELHDYVTRIASMYRHNPFHNLEHASHVTLSAVKLMRRIINPDDIDSSAKPEQAAPRTAKDIAFQRSLHESTFGISSDPLTQFCVVYSALIHDVDHEGVPNAQLVKEQAQVALKFGEKSAAEQNSVYIAWEMLMEPKYNVLRTCIYTNEDERKRFRRLVVNAVMATDILDKELQLVRKNRWEKAFDDRNSVIASTHHDRNRKATAVIEHIIQASDVAHTMQHWHIFRRWNERLFDEMYIAYKMGRTDRDPSLGWYQGQIGFFDGYIIPLAKKLKECGVFGVAGNEYLGYALENRREWELKGKEESEVMLANFHLRHGFVTDHQHWAEGGESIPEDKPLPEESDS